MSSIPSGFVDTAIETIPPLLKLKDYWTQKLNGIPQITLSFNRESWFLLIKQKNFAIDFIGADPYKLIEKAILAGDPAHKYFHSKKFETDEDLAFKLKEHRSKSKVTQTILAKRCQIAQSTYAEYESKNIQLTPVIYDDFITAINDIVSEREGHLNE